MRRNWKWFGKRVGVVWCSTRMRAIGTTRMEVGVTDQTADAHTYTHSHTHTYTTSIHPHTHIDLRF